MIDARRLALALLLVVACRTDGPAPGEPAAAAGSDAPPILTIGPMTPVSLRPGDTAQLALSLVVKDGFHVQANPAANEFLVPLELTLDDEPGLEVGPAVYPAPIPHRLRGSDDVFPTYEKSVTVAVPLSAAPEAGAGARSLRGTLRYQACDASRCYFPASVPISIPIVLGEPG